MRILIVDALDLWEEIPTENLMEATAQAIIEAGAFLATNGLVAKVWRGSETSEQRQIEAQRALRREYTERYSPNRLMSPEAAPCHPDEAAKEIAEIYKRHPHLKPGKKDSNV